MAYKKYLFYLWCFLIIVICIALFTGRYPTPFFLPIQNLINDRLAQVIVVNYRIPRLLTAVIFGMGLSVAGVCTQTILRNPIADNSIIGVSQAAAFGTIIGKLVAPNNLLIITLGGFSMGILSLIGVYKISSGIQKNSGDQLYAIIVSGIAFSALFSSGIGLIKYFVDSQNQLPDIIFWLMGGLWQINWHSVLLTTPLMILLIFWLHMYRFRLNALALPDEVAFSLGINKKREISLLLFIVVLITTLTVIFCGIISWVGLIVPNIARLFIGDNTLRLIPFSSVLGAIFLLVCDVVARSALPGEIPIGILTSFVGAAFLVIIMNKKTHNLKNIA